MSWKALVTEGFGKLECEIGSLQNTTNFPVQGLSIDSRNLVSISTALTPEIWLAFPLHHLQADACTTAGSHITREQYDNTNSTPCMGAYEASMQVIVEQ